MRFQPDEIYHLVGQSSVGMSFQQPVVTMVSIVLSTLNMRKTIRLLDRPVWYYKMPVRAIVSEIRIRQQAKRLHFAHLHYTR